MFRIGRLQWRPMWSLVYILRGSPSFSQSAVYGPIVGVYAKKDSTSCFLMWRRFCTVGFNLSSFTKAFAFTHPKQLTLLKLFSYFRISQAIQDKCQEHRNRPCTQSYWRFVPSRLFKYRNVYTSNNIAIFSGEGSIVGSIVCYMQRMCWVAAPIKLHNTN